MFILIKKTTHITLVISAVFLLLWGCDKSPYKGFKKTENGLYYKFYLQDKKGKKPEIGDVLNVHIVYRLKDSIIFDSKELNEPFRFPLDSSVFAGDIFEGLAMMAAGDSATFIIPADSLKKYEELDEIPEGSMLYFDVKLIDIQSKNDYEKEVMQKQQQLQKLIERLKEQEQKEIKDYVEKNKITIKPTASGLYFIPLKVGYGAKPEEGKFVGINYITTFLNGDTLYSSYEEISDAIYYEIGKSFEIPGIEEALKLMRTGGKAKLIMPSSLAYGEKGITDIVPPCTPLIFYLELSTVLDKDKYEKMMKDKESKMIEDFVKNNNITQKPDKYGLYFIELRKGTGERVQKGKKLKVHYTGKFLNGKIFDSSENSRPLTFVYDKGKVILGWELALAQMNEGGKAMLIVPSALAYGDAYTGIIPPYTPLVYELELLEVK